MTNSVLEELLEVETRVWEALRAGDARADAALLHPEFLGIYPSGFSDREGHAGQLADGPSVATYRIEDARVITLGPDTALLAYLARHHDTLAERIRSHDGRVVYDYDWQLNGPAE